MMEFLYFPEDKGEYIPSIIMLLIFITGAVIATFFIRKHSEKELSKMEQSSEVSLETPKEPKEPTRR
ncbi:hypothetical protein [Pseudalkalibacillus decolorationis]|uniref:hypothetical protein n=1 Tax=Pseudalkalibacillus decolorationis TaxID=163879 RepID=UPI0021474D1D|nr:hypothetical protein [Pseudalkalibacillus decolorationis]